MYQNSGSSWIMSQLWSFLLDRSWSNDPIPLNRKIWKFYLVRSCNPNQCILIVEESPLSEYNSTAGRTSPSTSLVWMGKSIYLFFFHLPSMPSLILALFYAFLSTPLFPDAPNCVCAVGILNYSAGLLDLHCSDDIRVQPMGRPPKRNQCGWRGGPCKNKG